MTKTVALVLMLALALAAGPLATAKTSNAERNVDWLLDRLELEKIPDVQAQFYTSEEVTTMPLAEALAHFGERTQSVDLGAAASGAGAAGGTHAGDIWLVETAVEFSGAPSAQCPTPTVLAEQPVGVPVHPRFNLYEGFIHEPATSNIAQIGNGIWFAWTEDASGDHTGMTATYGPSSDLACIQFGFAGYWFTVNEPFINGVAHFA